MTIRHILGTAAGFGLFLLLPLVSFAYETTEQSAYRLSDTVALYTVSYEFGFLNADLWMPIQARQNIMDRSLRPQISYSLYNATDQLINDGTTYAIVLSDAEVDGNYYYVPAGERAEFTLLVLHQTTSGQLAGEAVSLAVGGLMGVINKDGEQLVVAPTVEQLAAYQTADLHYPTLPIGPGK